MKFLITLIGALLLFAGCSYQQKQPPLKPQPAEQVLTTTQTAYKNFIIAGFYPYWEQSKFPPQIAIDNNISMVYHAFVWPNKDGELVVPKNFENKEIVNICKTNNIKPIISVGGGATSTFFSTVLNNPILFDKFTSQLIDFIKTNHYDGIDIDWEFPKSTNDTLSLNNFVKTLRESLGDNFIISIDLPYANYTGRYFDIGFLQSYANYFVIMTYDYAGSWSPLSGYNAPLKKGFCNFHDIQKTIEYWLARGIRPKKMLLGIPFFGRAFTANEPCQEFSKSYAIAYRNILSLLNNENYQYFWDFMTKTPYLVNKNNKLYLSFDDLLSISDKLRFAYEMDLGGIAIWEITQDIVNDKHTLLRQISQIVKNNQLLNY